MRIAYISTYLSRECGIATFNDNVERAVQANFPDRAPLKKRYGIAINDSDELQTYAYPKHIKFVIRQNRQRDYIEATTLLNTSDVQAVVMEHEIGIFGGERGIYILPLLHRLEKPLFASS